MEVWLLLRSLLHPCLPPQQQEESWDFFDVVNSDPLPWLTKRVCEWESYADYNKVKTFVSTVKVVNDCAERAVALATDYYKVFLPFFYFMVDYLDMD